MFNRVLIESGDNVDYIPSGCGGTETTPPIGWRRHRSTWYAAM